MQGTLFKFGITKEIKSSSGRLYDVTASMPLFVEDSDVSIQCEICNEKSKNSSIWIFTSFGSIIEAIKLKNRKENWKLTLVCKS